MMKRAIKDIFLLITGTLLGVLSTLLFETPIRLTLTIIIGIISVILASYGLSLFDIVFHYSIKLLRNFRSNRKRLVGILHDMNWNTNRETICSWTNLTTYDWYQEISKNNKGKSNYIRLSPKKMSISSNLNRYNAILNPFGGVYPEKDTVNFTYLDKIFNYVSDGGIFINVSDVPGYWMYHTELKTRIDATPTIYGVLQMNNNIKVIPIKPFEKTPFMEKLSIRVINTSKYINANCKYSCPDNFFKYDEIPKKSAERLAIIDKNIQPIIVIEIPNMPEKFTPVFCVPYGKGKFYFNLYYLDKKYPQNKIMLEKIIHIIRIM